MFAKLEAVLRAELELGATQAKGLESSVWTLTYDPEFLPAGGDVSRSDATGFRKRVQLEMHRQFGVRVRVWGPAEYGDGSLRAHYHFILFGVDSFDVRHCAAVRSAWSRDGRSMGGCWCDYAGKAGVMKYLAGYCVKKWNRPCEQLQGHAPEFTVWPQRPPLGGALADAIALSLAGPVGLAAIAARGQDVPGAIRRNGRLVPLPRTLRRRARKLLGLDSPEATLMRKVFQSCRDRAARMEFPGDWYDPQAHVNEGGIAGARARRKLYESANRKGSL